MRRLPVLVAFPLLLASLPAHASPFALTRGVQPAAEPAPAPAPEQPAPESPETAPTSSPAPDSGPQQPQPEGPVEEKPLAQPTEAAVTGETSLSDEREKVADPEAFNRHGVGVRAGLVVIPTWLLSSFLTTHSNALCRKQIGNFADQRGLIRQDGCNFSVAGEYTYRKSRILDIVGAVGYQRAHAPDSYWLDKDEWGDSCTDSTLDGRCNLSAADYTRVDMHILMIEADFIARAPLVVTKDVEFGLGGGAGIGIIAIFGGVYQTPLGNSGIGGGHPAGYVDGMSDGGSCRRLEDLKDFTRCTPVYDAEESPHTLPEARGMLSDMSPGNGEGFAACTENGCHKGDLKVLGERKNSDIPPVLPLVNLILSARLIVKDVWGMTINGGWNTGFYFGGGMQYYFSGKGGKKADKKKEPKTARRNIRRLSLM